MDHEKVEKFKSLSIYRFVTVAWLNISAFIKSAFVGFAKSLKCHTGLTGVLIWESLEAKSIFKCCTLNIVFFTQLKQINTYKLWNK